MTSFFIIKKPRSRIFESKIQCRPRSVTRDRIGDNGRIIILPRMKFLPENINILRSNRSNDKIKCVESIWIRDKGDRLEETREISTARKIDIFEFRSWSVHPRIGETTDHRFINRNPSVRYFPLIRRNGGTSRGSVAVRDRFLTNDEPNSLLMLL